MSKNRAIDFYVFITLVVTAMKTTTRSATYFVWPFLKERDTNVYSSRVAFLLSRIPPNLPHRQKNDIPIVLQLEKKHYQAITPSAFWFTTEVTYSYNQT
jgi:hypothetical protein